MGCSREKVLEMQELAQSIDVVVHLIEIKDRLEIDEKGTYCSNQGPTTVDGDPVQITEIEEAVQAGVTGSRQTDVNVEM